MKKILSLIIVSIMLLMMALPVFAGSGEAMTTVEFTVLDSDFDAESNSHRIMVSNRSYAYSTYDGVYNWYYTTLTTEFSLEDDEVTLSSDGSEIGDTILEAVRRGEPVPVGTVVKLTWNGLIAESYPPQIGRVYAFEFTGITTDYSFDDMMSEHASLREMGWGWHDEISPEGVRCAEKADFTVAYCDSSTAKEGKYAKTGSTLYLVKNDDTREFICLTVDTDKFPVGRSRDADSTELCSGFLKTGELPIGTVVSISWSGIILDSYPGVLEGVFDLAITPDETNLSTKVLDETMKGYFEEFDIDNRIEHASASEPEPNPRTGVAMPVIALAGVLIWSVSVTCLRKR